MSIVKAVIITGLAGIFAAVLANMEVCTLGEALHLIQVFLLAAILATLQDKGSNPH